LGEYEIEEAKMTGYGAVENRPKSGVVTGAVVGTVLLAAAIAGVIYYQSAERRRLDAMDYDALNAEHDALKAVAEPLRRLEEAVSPETPPADYARLLAEARAAYERYASPPRRQTPLPSRRPWPGQFDAAARLAKESLDHFGLASYYLDQRAKAKPSKVTGTANVDADIENVLEDATEPLHDLLASLDRMQAQRDAHAWDYGPAPKAKT
jgi:hypothetical protein